MNNHLRWGLRFQNHPAFFRTVVIYDFITFWIGLGICRL